MPPTSASLRRRSTSGGLELEPPPPAALWGVDRDRVAGGVALSGVDRDRVAAGVALSGVDRDRAARHDLAGLDVEGCEAEQGACFILDSLSNSDDKGSPPIARSNPFHQPVRRDAVPILHRPSARRMVRLTPREG